MTTTQYFRVDGADQQTGEETYLVLQAPTKPLAEKLARQQGLLISSVRVARPDDWAGETDEGAPEPPPPVPEEPEYHEDAAPAHSDYAAKAEPFLDPSEAAGNHAASYDLHEEHDERPGESRPAAGAGPSAAAAIVLACAGSALVLGGVLAVVLGLWPDAGVRNELQQFDFRLHELSQTLFGGMLILGGLIVFVLAVICYLLPRRG